MTSTPRTTGSGAPARESSPLHVQTAAMTYRGPHALNVTTKLGGPLGQVFAPSRKLVGMMLEGREYRKDLEQRGEGREALLELQLLWEHFAPEYILEMRDSYRTHRDEWEDLLARPNVVLVCFCTDPRFCHRTLLGRDILPKLGAVFEGEISKPPLPQDPQGGLFR